ncbi:Rne/Rng family ribonuclease [Pandoraea nosoerga]|uniref:Ribonuclease E n=1 Tax=Pandoraea nosoerga TaxID=2508296 RepID=A0A5E4SWR3_9BURK|nr:Rne/Rng family ribonuclease [Pandoraea nosoerga]MBN4665681.1 Rne/Rng family ribonuclease [Pandoraea nosoerga]MBN4675620.1 Rne/Rng family ribonuclease [Pandoraea nosoerga]MBN4680997.1 Rne/Rng family ribonuclease [Pandoraea nosoerga]MBN4744721.1 Rne/Rng family ribonuclease [Pandoraea nosoerga]VVD80077.1 ribonuclease E [Pandoraea nosoerga]
MKRMLFNATQQEELRVAIVDGQKLIDIDIETAGREQRKGNIYKGVITRIEPSLEACFVNYGEGRHGFLPFKEVARAYFRDGADVRNARIQDALSEGQELIVQVEKEERGNKGAALTTFISLAGRYLVLMPNNPRGGGVSRRIEGEDRQELRETMAQLELPEGMSIIARTAGIGRSAEELQWDLNYLLQLWRAIEGAAHNIELPRDSALIYLESSLVIRAIRDYFQPDIGEILIDTEEIAEQARNFMQVVMPDHLNRVKQYRDDVPLFSRFQIEHQIETAYSRQVPLPSGGAIVIDHTEALVSIDVNSARATKGADIEETALRTNLEAADEVARQLRLRDLGGLIVIDFIDMESAKSQREVEQRVKDALKHDRARVQMGKISRFGLMELSRQRLRPSLSEGTHVTCPRCNGTGHIRDAESSALQVLRIIQEEAMKEHTAAIHCQVPVEVAAFLLNEKRQEINKIEARFKVGVLLIPNKHLETPHYKLERLRFDDPRLDAPKASYALAEEAARASEDDPAGYSKKKEDVRPRQEAAVKGITPEQPAPAAQPRAEAIVPAAPVAAPARSGGFLGFVKRLLGLEPAAPAPVKTEAPAKPAARAPRERHERPHQQNRNRRGNARDENKSGKDNAGQTAREGRDGREGRGARPERAERNERNEPRQEGRDKRERDDAQRQAAQDVRTEEGREPREGRERGSRRDRNERRERRQAEGAEGQQAAPQRAAQPSAPVAPPAAAQDDAEQQDRLTAQIEGAPAVGPEGETGEQGSEQGGEERRRSRRRGRRGGRREREANEQQLHADGEQGEGIAAEGNAEGARPVLSDEAAENAAADALARAAAPLAAVAAASAASSSTSSASPAQKVEPTAAPAQAAQATAQAAPVAKVVETAPAATPEVPAPVVAEPIAAAASAAAVTPVTPVTPAPLAGADTSAAPVVPPVNAPLPAAAPVPAQPTVPAEALTEIAATAASSSAVDNAPMQAPSAPVETAQPAATGAPETTDAPSPAAQPVDAATAQIAQTPIAPITSTTPTTQAVTTVPEAAAAATEVVTQKPAAVAVEPTLERSALESTLASVGLVWVHTDADKLRAAREAAAKVVPAPRVPRERRPVAPLNNGPMEQVETRAPSNHAV